MNEEPKVGDRVRVLTSREGVVSQVSEYGLVLEGGFAVSKTFGTPKVEIEILERAKSKWLPGDITIGNMSKTLRVLRDDGRWYDCMTGALQSSSVNHDNTTLIVRDGKPVEEAL